MKLQPFTLLDAIEVAGWRYPGEFAEYNLPEWKEMCARRWGMTLREKREQEFYSVVLHDRLAGFIRLMEDRGAWMLGVGLRPDLCSKGLGAELIRLARELARQRGPERALRLKVRKHNQRAVRCYQKAGFVLVEPSIPDETFFWMEDTCEG